MLSSGPGKPAQAEKGKIMADASDKKQPMSVADLVQRTEARPLPVVAEQSTVEEIIAAFANSAHTRLLYVVDDEGCLGGVISLGRLERHVLHAYHEPKIHARHLMNMISSETASHLMQKETVSASMDEDVDTVLQRMISNNVKEVAVLDQSRRVIADLTLVDLLKYCKIYEGGC